MGCRQQCLLFSLTLVITRGLLLCRCFFNLKFKLTKTPSLHHLLVKMPTLTRNSKNLSSSSSTTPLKPPQDCPNIHNDFLSPLKQNSAEKRSLVSGISHSGSRSAKCPVFRNNVVGVREVSTPRRSLRLSLLQDPNTNQLVNNKTSNCKSDDEGVWSSNKGKDEVETSDRRGVVTGLQASNARESAVGIMEFAICSSIRLICDGPWKLECNLCNCQNILIRISQIRETKQFAAVIVNHAQIIVNMAFIMEDVETRK